MSCLLLHGQGQVKSGSARPSAPAHRCCVSCSTSLPLLGVFLCVAATCCEVVLSSPCVPFNVVAVESYSGQIYVLSCLAFETHENGRVHRKGKEGEWRFLW